MRRRDGTGSLKFPQNGAQKVRDEWHERFAETPDVLKNARRQQTVVPVLDLEIGGDEFITMAGPCSVETEFQLMATANHVRRAGARILRGGAFKPRSSPYAFQGHGLEGLKMLARAREESGLAIVTEVMSEEDVPLVAEYADILQIGTRNMENYALLEAAARSGRPVLLKRGMVATIADFLRSAQVILDNGNPNVILCERGIRTFETALRNTFDVAAIALLKHISHLPVIADPSHAAGHRDLVPALARISVAAGADGLLVEVHPNPEKAWSDGEQSLDFRGFDEMMAGLDPWLALRGLVRSEQKTADRERGFQATGARAMEAVG
jgi:3-deoxy-7-phosphoheptulonate synthase